MQSAVASGAQQLGVRLAPFASGRRPSLAWRLAAETARRLSGSSAPRRDQPTFVGAQQLLAVAAYTVGHCRSTTLEPSMDLQMNLKKPMRFTACKVPGRRFGGKHVSTPCVTSIAHIVFVRIGKDSKPFRCIMLCSSLFTAISRNKHGRSTVPSFTSKFCDTSITSCILEVT